jgi:hypothetical protein
VKLAASAALRDIAVSSSVVVRAVAAAFPLYFC